MYRLGLNKGYKMVVEIVETKYGKRKLYLGKGCLNYSIGNTSYHVNNLNKSQWYFENGNYTIDENNCLILQGVSSIEEDIVAYTRKSSASVIGRIEVKNLVYRTPWYFLYPVEIR